MQFEIELEASHLHRILEAARQALATPQELLGAIGESVLLKNRDRHAQGLTPDGTPWKPLAPLTIGSDIWNKQDATFRKSNTRRGPMFNLKVARQVQVNRRVLYASGSMLDSFNYQIRGDEVVLGFDGSRDVQLAAWHHGGTDPYTISATKAKALGFAGLCRKRVNHPGLPARPLVGFPTEDAQAVVEEVEDYLVRALRNARGR